MHHFWRHLFSEQLSPGHAVWHSSKLLPSRSGLLPCNPRSSGAAGISVWVCVTPPLPRRRLLQPALVPCPCLAPDSPRASHSSLKDALKMTVAGRSGRGWGRESFWVPSGCLYFCKATSMRLWAAAEPGSVPSQSCLSRPLWAPHASVLVLVLTRGPPVPHRVWVNTLDSFPSLLLLFPSCILFPCLGSHFPPPVWMSGARAT